MSDLQLNSTSGDLEIEGGDFVMLSSDVGALTKLDWITQTLQCQLRTFLNEWFLQTDDGVPYFQEILKKNANPDVIEAILLNRVVTSPGILEILVFDLTYDNPTRTLTLDLAVRSTEGVIEFEDFNLGAT